MGIQDVLVKPVRHQELMKMIRPNLKSAKILPKSPSKKPKRPKISVLHDEIPEHVQEFMHLTRLAEMGRLAANVAHEINNPLMVAQGFAENIELLLDSETFSRDEIRLQVLEIIKSCQRMARIVTKMNRMSRSQKLRLFVVDLAEVALNSVDFLKTQIKDADVVVEFDFEHPMPIKCDAVQVEQIILNILSNALFAIGPQETEKRIRISFEQFGKWQQIKVWNNGPTIPTDVQKRIMSPFLTTKEEAKAPDSAWPSVKPSCRCMAGISRLRALLTTALSSSCRSRAQS